MKSIATDLQTKRFVRGQPGEEAKAKIRRRGALAEKKIQEQIRMSFATEKEWREWIMGGVRRRWSTCTACPLKRCRPVVMGRGTVDPVFAIVGGATTSWDATQERAWSGPEGALLRRVCVKAGISLQHAWLSRAVACRPPGDRTLRREERTACKNRLFAELAVVKPRVLILLGKASMRALEGVGRHDEVEDLRGLVPRDAWPVIGEGGWRCRAVFLSHSPGEILRARSKRVKRRLVMELIKDLKKANRVVDYLVRKREA